MSIHNEIIDQICESTGEVARVVSQELKPAILTLEKAQAYGFETIEEYKEAIIDYVYN